MRVIFNDGGRAVAGYKGIAGDCVVRSIAIAAQMDYQVVYDAINAAAQSERKGTRKRGISNARTGVYRPLIRKYLASLGWTWIPTMHIGSGCTVHLADNELPFGRLIVSLSKHVTAVIDGVIHDTHDPQREPQHVYSGETHIDANGQTYNPIIQTIGGRCVYGYWVKL